MRDVSVIGIGQTPVGEHWDKSLRHLAYEALAAAMRDANLERADAIYVGNMLSGEVSGQAHLGPLVADFAGLRGIGFESNGNVKGCLSMPADFIEGNIRDQTLREIWDDPDNFAYNRKFRAPEVRT